MKIIKAIRDLLTGLSSQYHSARNRKRQHYLDNISREFINVMEFNGHLYIAHKGVPIVRVDDLKIKATELLVKSREDYLAWKAKFNV